MSQDVADIQAIFDRAEALENDIRGYAVDSEESLESFRIEFIGSKGSVKRLMGEMRNIPNERKKDYGQLVNRVKETAEGRYNELKAGLSKAARAAGPSFDMTAPATDGFFGSRHPLQQIRQEFVRIFGRIGFAVAEGPEIEDDWHNFTALNTPEHHPARDMQDTFYIKDNPDLVLRTHTSPVQARIMETQKPPIRIIAPGRTYRNETISARAHCIFHQVEGLYVDEGVSFADLKQTLLYFAQEMFGANTTIRLRPSYFPFTEPSAELDISCFLCDGKGYFDDGSGCSICKKTGWVEVGGCGMVDPAVFEKCGVDPERYTGFAFGMGIERTAMLKYRINDIRLFSENDLRFLKQFEHVI